MLQDLIYIADRLDKSGFYRRANSIDSIIKKIAGLNSEETVIFDEKDSDMTKILDPANPQKPNWREYGAGLIDRGIRENIREIFSKIDWDKLKEDWVGPGPDPLLKHKDRALEAIKNRDESDELQEYFYFISYLDLPKDIDGWNTMTPEERRVLSRRQQHLQNTIIRLLE